MVIGGNQKYERTDWSFVGLSLFISADQHGRLSNLSILTSAGMNFSAQWPVVPVGLLVFHHHDGCGAPGSTSSSVVISGFILVQNWSARYCTFLNLRRA